MSIPVRVSTERKASPGKFRVIVTIDSEEYQLGEDLQTIEAALDMVSRSRKLDPYQIYDDQGTPQV